MSSSGWDRARQRSKQVAEQDGLFIKLVNDGDSFVGAFLGEPYIRETYWNPAKNSSEDYTHEHRVQGLKSTPNYKINVYLPALKQIRIWELKSKTFDAVCDVLDRFPMDKYFIFVKRNGAKGDTKTRFTILPDGEIGPDHRDIISRLKLHDLGPQAAQPQHAQNGAWPPSTNSASPAYTSQNGYHNPGAVPIDTNIAQTLHTRLTATGRGKQFLQKFGIQRVSELPSGRLPDAMRFIEQLEALAAAPPPPPPPPPPPEPEPETASPYWESTPLVDDEIPF